MAHPDPEVERLITENERMRKALWHIAWPPELRFGGSGVITKEDLMARAKTAFPDPPGELTYTEAKRRGQEWEQG